MSGTSPDLRRRALPAWLAALLPGRGGAEELDGLVERLPPVEYRRAADEESLFEQSSLAKVLPLLVKVDQEAEYLLCREVAEHALGAVPDPGTPSI